MPADLRALIAEAEGLCEAATPGPWVADENGEVCTEPHFVDGEGVQDIICGACSYGPSDYQDAAFIARARTLLPALVTALRQRPGREEVERRLREIRVKGVMDGYAKNYNERRNHQDDADKLIRALLDELCGPEGEAR